MTIKTYLAKIQTLLKTRKGKNNLLFIVMIGGYFPLGLALALLIPDNILEYPWARTYTDFMASWLTYVAEVGRWTRVPATQFIAAVMNAAAILWSVAFVFVQLMHAEEMMEKLRGDTVKDKLITYLGIIPLMTCVAVFYFYQPISHPPRTRDLSEIGSNLGMSTYGSMFILGGWMIPALVVVFSVLGLASLYRRLLKKKQ